MGRHSKLNLIMSDIIERTFSAGADKCLTLDNREYARKMLIGSDWNRIRIGALVSLTPNGTSNLSAIKFVMGACSGITNPFSAGSTTNFIGASIGADDPASGNTFSYNAGSGNPYFTSSSTTGKAVKRVGATNTLSASRFNSNSCYLPSNSGSVQRRWPVFVEITKGSPNYTVKLLSPSSAADMSTDVSPSSFASLLMTSGDLSNFWNTASGNAQTVACDEGAGGFDSVCLFYNSPLYPLEVYDLRVYRFS